MSLKFWNLYKGSPNNPNQAFFDNFQLGEALKKHPSIKPKLTAGQLHVNGDIDIMDSEAGAALEFQLSEWREMESRPPVMVMPCFIASHITVLITTRNNKNEERSFFIDPFGGVEQQGSIKDSTIPPAISQRGIKKNSATIQNLTMQRMGNGLEIGNGYSCGDIVIAAAVVAAEMDVEALATISPNAFAAKIIGYINSTFGDIKTGNGLEKMRQANVVLTLSKEEFTEENATNAVTAYIQKNQFPPQVLKLIDAKFDTHFSVPAKKPISSSTKKAIRTSLDDLWKRYINNEIPIDPSNFLANLKKALEDIATSIPDKVTQEKIAAIQKNFASIRNPQGKKQETLKTLQTMTSNLELLLLKLEEQGEKFPTLLKDVNGKKQLIVGIGEDKQNFVPLSERIGRVANKDDKETQRKNQQKVKKQRDELSNKVLQTNISANPLEEFAYWVSERVENGVTLVKLNENKTNFLELSDSILNYFNLVDENKTIAVLNRVRDLIEYIKRNPEIDNENLAAFMHVFSDEIFKVSETFFLSEHIPKRDFENFKNSIKLSVEENALNTAIRQLEQALKPQKKSTSSFLDNFNFPSIFGKKSSAPDAKKTTEQKPSNEQIVLSLEDEEVESAKDTVPAQKSESTIPALPASPSENLESSLWGGPNPLEPEPKSAVASVRNIDRESVIGTKQKFNCESDGNCFYNACAISFIALFLQKKLDPQFAAGTFSQLMYKLNDILIHNEPAIMLIEDGAIYTNGKTTGITNEIAFFKAYINRFKKDPVNQDERKELQKYFAAALREYTVDYIKDHPEGIVTKAAEQLEAYNEYSTLAKLFISRPDDAQKFITALADTTQHVDESSAALIRSALSPLQAFGIFLSTRQFTIPEYNTSIMEAITNADIEIDLETMGVMQKWKVTSNVFNQYHQIQGQPFWNTFQKLYRLQSGENLAQIGLADDEILKEIYSDNIPASFIGDEDSIKTSVIEPYLEKWLSPNHQGLEDYLKVIGTNAEWASDHEIENLPPALQQNLDLVNDYPNPYKPVTPISSAVMIAETDIQQEPFCLIYTGNHYNSYIDPESHAQITNASYDFLSEEIAHPLAEALPPPVASEAAESDATQYFPMQGPPAPISVKNDNPPVAVESDATQYRPMPKQKPLVPKPVKRTNAPATHPKQTAIPVQNNPPPVVEAQSNPYASMPNPNVAPQNIPSLINPAPAPPQPPNIAEYAPVSVVPEEQHIRQIDLTGAKESSNPAIIAAELSLFDKEPTQNFIAIKTKLDSEYRSILGQITNAKDANLEIQNLAAAEEVLFALDTMRQMVQSLIRVNNEVFAKNPESLAIYKIAQAIAAIKKLQSNTNQPKSLQQIRLDSTNIKKYIQAIITHTQKNHPELTLALQKLLAEQKTEIIDIPALLKKIKAIVKSQTGWLGLSNKPFEASRKEFIKTAVSLSESLQHFSEKRQQLFIRSVDHAAINDINNSQQEIFNTCFARINELMETFHEATPFMSDSPKKLEKIEHAYKKFKDAQDSIAIGEDVRTKSIINYELDQLVSWKKELATIQADTPRAGATPEELEQHYKKLISFKTACQNYRRFLDSSYTVIADNGRKNDFTVNQGFNTHLKTFQDTTLAAAENNELVSIDKAEELHNTLFGIYFTLKQYEEKGVELSRQALIQRLNIDPELQKITDISSQISAISQQAKALTANSSAAEKLDIIKQIFALRTDLGTCQDIYTACINTPSPRNEIVSQFITEYRQLNPIAALNSTLITLRKLLSVENYQLEEIKQAAQALDAIQLPPAAQEGSLPENALLDDGLAEEQEIPKPGDGGNPGHDDSKHSPKNLRTTHENDATAVWLAAEKEKVEGAVYINHCERSFANGIGAATGGACVAGVGFTVFAATALSGFSALLALVPLAIVFAAEVAAVEFATHISKKRAVEQNDIDRDQALQNSIMQLVCSPVSERLSITQQALGLNAIRTYQIDDKKRASFVDKGVDPGEQNKKFVSQLVVTLFLFEETQKTEVPGAYDEHTYSKAAINALIDASISNESPLDPLIYNLQHLKNARNIAPNKRAELVSIFVTEYASVLHKRLEIETRIDFKSPLDFLKKYLVTLQASGKLDQATKNLVSSAFIKEHLRALRNVFSNRQINGSLADRFLISQHLIDFYKLEKEQGLDHQNSLSLLQAMIDDCFEPDANGLFNSDKAMLLVDNLHHFLQNNTDEEITAPLVRFFFQRATFKQHEIRDRVSSDEADALYKAALIKLKALDQNNPARVETLLSQAPTLELKDKNKSRYVDFVFPEPIKKPETAAALTNAYVANSELDSARIWIATRKKGFNAKAEKYKARRQLVRNIAIAVLVTVVIAVVLGYFFLPGLLSGMVFLTIFFVATGAGFTFGGVGTFLEAIFRPKFTKVDERVLDTTNDRDAREITADLVKKLLGGNIAKSLCIEEREHGLNIVQLYQQSTDPVPTAKANRKLVTQCVIALFQKGNDKERPYPKDFEQVLARIIKSSLDLDRPEHLVDNIRHLLTQPPQIASELLRAFMHELYLYNQDMSAGFNSEQARTNLEKVMCAEGFDLTSAEKTKLVMLLSDKDATVQFDLEKVEPPVPLIYVNFQKNLEALLFNPTENVADVWRLDSLHYLVSNYQNRPKSNPSPSEADTKAKNFAETWVKNIVEHNSPTSAEVAKEFNDLFAYIQKSNVPGDDAMALFNDCWGALGANDNALADEVLPQIATANTTSLLKSYLSSNDFTKPECAEYAITISALLSTISPKKMDDLKQLIITLRQPMRDFKPRLERLLTVLWDNGSGKENFRLYTDALINITPLDSQTREIIERFKIETLKEQGYPLLIAFNENIKDVYPYDVRNGIAAVRKNNNGKDTFTQIFKGKNNIEASCKIFGKLIEELSYQQGAYNFEAKTAIQAAFLSACSEEIFVPNDTNQIKINQMRRWARQALLRSVYQTAVYNSRNQIGHIKSKFYDIISVFNTNSGAELKDKEAKVLEKSLTSELINMNTLDLKAKKERITQLICDAVADTSNPDMRNKLIAGLFAGYHSVLATPKIDQADSNVKNETPYLQAIHAQIETLALYREIYPTITTEEKQKNLASGFCQSPTSYLLQYRKDVIDSDYQVKWVGNFLAKTYEDHITSKKTDDFPNAIQKLIKAASSNGVVDATTASALTERYLRGLIAVKKEVSAKDPSSPQMANAANTANAAAISATLKWSKEYFKENLPKTTVEQVVNNVYQNLSHSEKLYFGQIATAHYQTNRNSSVIKDLEKHLADCTKDALPAPASRWSGPGFFKRDNNTAGQDNEKKKLLHDKIQNVLKALHDGLQDPRDFVNIITPLIKAKPEAIATVFIVALNAERENMNSDQKEESAKLEAVLEKVTAVYRSLNPDNDAAQQTIRHLTENRKIRSSENDSSEEQPDEKTHLLLNSDM